MSFILNFFSRLFDTSQPSSNIRNSAPETKPLPCKYRLDNGTSSTFTLPCGRKLGYAEYGSPTGYPILYLHGLPGARIEAARHDDLGRELGARIIGVDRPGIGWSSPHPNRTLLDFPKDLECLAEHLGLEKYSVWGISGGGPSALASAFALPSSKLQSVSIVCGLGPPDIGMRGANWLHYLAFTWGYRFLPYWIGRIFWSRQITGRLDLSDSERLSRSLHPVASLQNRAFSKDIQVILENPDALRLSLQAGREAFAQGYDAVWQDARVMCMDWGFKVQDIRKDLEVQLWYGKNDGFVPLNHGLQIVARLGEKAWLRVEDEGHSGISINWNRQILEAVVRSGRV